jgi:hypothetical protein
LFWQSSEEEGDDERERRSPQFNESSDKAAE